MKALLAAAAVLIAVTAARAEMIRVESAHPVNVTMDRLAAAIEGAGATVFARIDQRKATASVGVEIPPSTVMIFGSPKIGAPIMRDAITIGLDLPLRVLAYREGDTVWLVYHDPADVAAAHGLPADHPVVARMRGALKKLTGKATAE